MQRPQLFGRWPSGEVREYRNQESTSSVFPAPMGSALGRNECAACSDPHSIMELSCMFGFCLCLLSNQHRPLVGSLRMHNSLLTKPQICQRRSLFGATFLPQSMPLCFKPFWVSKQIALPSVLFLREKNSFPNIFLMNKKSAEKFSNNIFTAAV